MNDLLSRLDSAIDGLCPCGAEPAEGSAYCGDDCQPTHIAADTGHGNAMRWRPDLVTAAPDDPDLEFVDSAGGYAGPFNATVYQRSITDVWHLRLDDGHRWVGCDLDAQGATGEALLQMMASVWRRLERELADPRHTVPGDPFRDVAREWAAPCSRRPQRPRHLPSTRCSARSSSDAAP